MDRRCRTPLVPGRLASGLLGAALLFAASGWAAAAVTVDLKETLVRDVSSSGLIMSYRIGVFNDDSSERSLVRYRYRVTVNRREFLNMDVVLDEPITIPPGREILIALPVKITYALLFETVGLVEEKAACETVGEMFFESERRREVKVPFAFSGDFPIFEDPELGFLPLKVNSVTIGGADVAFRPRFRNSVGYDLIVDRIRYRLFLDGREILSGDIPGEKTIPGRGERAFDLSFLIDFFDLGQEIRSKFEAGSLPFRFTGELEIASVWGNLLVPFDKSDDVTVEKNP